MRLGRIPKARAVPRVGSKALETQIPEDEGPAKGNCYCLHARQLLTLSSQIISTLDRRETPELIAFHPRSLRREVYVLVGKNRCEAPHLQNLPTEILLHLYDFLDKENAGALRRTCKKLSGAGHPSLFRSVTVQMIMSRIHEFTEAVRRPKVREDLQSIKLVLDPIPTRFDDHLFVRTATESKVERFPLFDSMRKIELFGLQRALKSLFQLLGHCPKPLAIRLVVQFCPEVFPGFESFRIQDPDTASHRAFLNLISSLYDAGLEVEYFSSEDLSSSLLSLRSEISPFQQKLKHFRLCFSDDSLAERLDDARLLSSLLRDTRLKTFDFRAPPSENPMYLGRILQEDFLGALEKLSLWNIEINPEEFMKGLFRMQKLRWVLLAAIKVRHGLCCDVLHHLRKFCSNRESVSWISLRGSWGEGSDTWKFSSEEHSPYTVTLYIEGIGDTQYPVQ